MHNKKLTIVFDWDSTTFNTNLAICELYKIYNPNSPFYPRHEDVKRWSYKDQIPEITNDEINSYFNDERLFDLMTFFMDKNTSMKDLINELIAEGHTVKIVTKSTDINISLKRRLLLEKLPQLEPHNLIGVPMDVHGKPDEYMCNADILIDDVDANFNNSVKYKILFANQGEKEWNVEGLSNPELIKAKSVTDLANIIFDIISFERSR
jgi:5'(3')-deoxyribonucleotidase